jgi:hypothetical protein
MKSVKISDMDYRKIQKIAKREQRAITVIISRMVELYLIGQKEAKP